MLASPHSHGPAVAPRLVPFVSEAFTAHLDTWCSWLEHNAGRSPATVSKYRAHLVRWLSWFVTPPDNPRLAPVGADPLRPTLADLERFAGLYAHSLKLTPAARRPLVSALRGFFEWLETSGAIASNPAASLAQPKGGSPLPRAASLRDGERLLMAPDIATFAGLRDACILALLMGCGLRVSGLVGMNDSALTWHDDDQGRESLVVTVTEKGKKQRIVPAPREVAMLLRAYLGHEDLAAIPRTLANGDRVLFVSLNNRNVPACDYYGEARRMSRGAVLDLIKRHAEAAGIPPAVAHPHALRHLFGAELAEDDAPILQHSSLMGHSDPKSTGVYAHLAHRKLRALIDRSNPLSKMRAPILDTLRSLDRAISPASAPVRGRAGLQKSKSGDPL